MIDLHTHSSFSDGSDSPDALLELAEQAGCTALALTDHDTVNGMDIAQKAAERIGIQLIAGVELSCHTEHRTIHILGYFVDPENAEFERRLSGQRELRNSRNARLVERLNSLGLDITINDVMAHAKHASVGRPHVAAALVTKGYATSIQDAFTRYLEEGAPGYIERRELTAAEGIQWIRQAGGVAVWAHPLTPLRYRDSNLQPELEQLVDVGLGGIEAWYSRYQSDQRKRLVKMAKRFDIVATGGSDYHGTYKTNLVLGRGEGDLIVPLDAVDALAERATPID